MLYDRFDDMRSKESNNAPILQTKTVTPTKEGLTVLPDSRI